MESVPDRDDPDPLTPAPFSSARRGYDRDEVDRYVAEAQTELRRLAAETRELHTAIARTQRDAEQAAQASIAPPNGNDPLHSWGLSVKLLTEGARADIERIRQDARQDADRLVEGARQIADQLVEAAGLTADDIIRAASEEADQLLLSATMSAEQTCADATREREQSVAALESARQRVLDTADSVAELTDQLAVAEQLAEQTD